MSLKLATLQMSIGESAEDNLRKALCLIEPVGRDTLLLLPELFFCGFDYDRMEEFSRMSGYVIEALSEVSREKGALVCCTVPEKTPKGIENTAILIDKGEVIGKRSKIKLFPPFQEDKHFVPGSENPLFMTRFGKVGVLVCFELRFPELVLKLWKEGVDILLVPAQWGYERKEHLRVLSRGRAIELQSYVIVSNTWNEHRGIHFAGGSSIHSPWGEVLAFSERGDTLLQTTYDPSLPAQVRELLPCRFKIES
ncbi:MAG TPA: carbon-nitrogen hydrolase family protein [Aquificaceae bacterium]|nr:carbon-nitrogen hydrolase family protein [Aquificaceae bacterium]HIQ31051.1 carbon-nitrogen hydrolase family protein [Aquifex aeolicus]